MYQLTTCTMGSLALTYSLLNDPLMALLMQSRLVPNAGPAIGQQPVQPGTDLQLTAR